MTHTDTPTTDTPTLASTYRAADVHCWCRGSGPPALLVHGNPATHTLWRPLFDPLAERRRVVAVDLPGFGASPLPRDGAPLTLDGVARLMLATADMRGIGRFDLIAHSYGSAVAITMAAVAPERIRSLTLITPLADRIPPVGRPAYIPWIRRMVSALWKLLPSSLRRRMIRGAAHLSAGRAYSRERAEEIADELDRKEAIDAILGVMAGIDYDAYRRSIRTVAGERPYRLLLIGSERDRVIPYAQFLEMRKLLRPDRERIFPDGEHLVMWQHRAELLEAITDFLEEADGRLH